MSPVMRKPKECDEYECGKPDDITPNRMAELAVNMIREAELKKPYLVPMTPEEKKIIEEDENAAPAKRHDKALWKKARRMYRYGMSQAEIGAKLGIPVPTIQRWCRPSM